MSREYTAEERATEVAKGCSLCHRAAVLIVRFTDTGHEWPSCDVHGDPKRIKDLAPGLVQLLNLDGSLRG